MKTTAETFHFITCVNTLHKANEIYLFHKDDIFTDSNNVNDAKQNI